MTQTWLLRLMKWYGKYQHFMNGRYGRIDVLNRTLIIISIICNLIAPFIPYHVTRYLGTLVLGSAIYRFLSKRLYIRGNENQHYLKLISMVKSRVNKEKNTSKQLFQIISCPNCQQKLRVPKGRGKIKITCSRCKHQMVKKV